MTGGLTGALGTELVWIVLSVGFGFVLGAVLAVLALLGRPIPAAALPSGLGVGALALIGLGRVSLVGWADLDADGLKLVVTTFGALPLVAFFVLLPTAATTWSVLAYAAARHPPRRLEYAVPGAVLVLLAAGLAAAGGFAGVNWIYSLVRAGLYVGVGSIAAVALLAGGDDGAEPGAGAALGFPLLVAVGEASERGLAQLLMLPTTSLVPADKWPEAVEQLLLVISPELPWSYAAIAAATGVAAIGAFVSVREGRGAAGVLGLGWAALAFAVLATADLGAERLEALAVLCPPP